MTRGHVGAAILAGVLLVVGQTPAGGKKSGSGEINTPPAKGERKKDALKPGDPAPDFTLPLLAERGEVKLSSFAGKKPVVLIFGSYT